MRSDGGCAVCFHQRKICFGCKVEVAGDFSLASGLGAGLVAVLLGSGPIWSMVALGCGCVLGAATGVLVLRRRRGEP